jgi:hypothetical protein
VRTRVMEGLSRIRAALGTPGAADRVAELAGRILEERGALDREGGP